MYAVSQLAGAGAGVVGGSLLGRSIANNGAGAQAQNAGNQNLGGQGLADPGAAGQANRQNEAAQPPPAGQISNVLNGGNFNNAPNNNGANRNAGSTANSGNTATRDTRANTGDQGSRSAADIAATSPQSNVFRQDAKTAATNPRETLSPSPCAHRLTTLPCGKLMTCHEDLPMVMLTAEHALQR